MSRSRVVTGLLIGALVVVALYPSLNAFTGGAVENRFSDTSSSGRDDLTSADLELFRSAPLFGLGVGVAKYERINTETAFAGVEAKARTPSTRDFSPNTGCWALPPRGCSSSWPRLGHSTFDHEVEPAPRRGVCRVGLITMAHINPSSDRPADLP